MRRQTPIAHLLYNHLYPHPTPSDPPTFSAHLARNLVPEVRIEVATFYGDLSTTEARYPGLNYCFGPHRMRLGRFKHHRRLFDAFDTLGLTYNEIQEFCCWEGTKWARERYERDEGVVVRDTTGEEIGWWVDPRSVEGCGRRGSITRKTDIEVMVERRVAREAEGVIAQVDECVAEEEEEDDAESGEDEDMADEEEETPAQAAAASHHILEVTRRRDRAIRQRVLNELNRTERNTGPPVTLEDIEKEESERGTHETGLGSVVNYFRRRAPNGYGTLSDRGVEVPNAVSTTRAAA